ncbi:MAG: hypothetical protein KGZ63_00890 [Clostridiales bacterium]|jgi:hypothetical protein|nr:hypothetical protein [Clostridiales bacterium]
MKSVVFKLAAALLLAALMLTLSGCGSSVQKKNDATNIMAWQFAQGLVRPMTAKPSNTVFPRFEEAFVERDAAGNFIISSYLTTLNEENNPVNYRFTVEAEYVGNDVFREVTVEVKKEQQ